jgi:hypothetical protein
MIEQKRGSCHCGKIAFEVEGDFARAVDCNCSHCQRKGYLLVMVPREALRLETPVETMSNYRFNRHVIDHKFCPDCGCAPFGFGTDENGKATAAINIRCLEEIDLTKVERIPFDGRSY